MNIKELKEIISNLPDEMEIIIQKDSEGNQYSPLLGVDLNSVYVPENTWYGEAYPTDWTADDAGMEEDEWEEILSKPRALILYPIN